MTDRDHPTRTSSIATSVILFGGLPASGKTTLARNIKDHFSGSCRVFHLEYDAFEDEIASQQKVKDGIVAWNQARETALQELERILKTPPDSTSLILMDDNFHLRGMRKKIHRLLLGHRPIRFGVIWLETDMVVCLQRNERRERQIPHDVILKMRDSLEPPKQNWERCWISVSDDTSFGSIRAFVENCEEIQDLPDDVVDPEQQERDRLKTIENQRHLWDNLLRKWVGQVAKHDKTLAPSANLARKEMLLVIKKPRSEVVTDDDLRCGFLESMVSSQLVPRADLHDYLSSLLKLN
eukprot:scaffold345_cov134-Cylindrotheca_fusiformis.AAC.46